MQYYKNDPFWIKIQSYLPEANRLTETALPSESFLQIADFQIHIDHYKPAKPKGKIILFHGVGGNGRLLSFIALPLMRDGFEVICPDMPLYGCTHYSGTVTYDTWVSCGSQIVKHYQQENPSPTFLFGLSAGGMLAYQVANECDGISGLIATCILDQRNPAVTKGTARNPLLATAGKPLLKAVRRFAGAVRIPMKLIGNMKAITNSKELAKYLMKDKKSSGVMVPLAFVSSMLTPDIKTEPEDFKMCPFLLVHPGADRWTDISLSLLFYDRLACDKRAIILEGAGHFPIEEIGLSQMERACIGFLNENLSRL